MHTQDTNTVGVVDDMGKSVGVADIEGESTSSKIGSLQFDIYVA